MTTRIECLLLGYAPAMLVVVMLGARALLAAHLGPLWLVGSIASGNAEVAMTLFAPSTVTIALIACGWKANRRKERLALGFGVAVWTATGLLGWILAGSLSA